jgi:hypothetical protein
MPSDVPIHALPPEGRQAAMARRLRPRNEQAKASSLIHRLDDLETETRRDGKTLFAIGYIRVSTWGQQKKQNLQNRRAWLERELKRREIRYLSIYEEVACGKRLDNRPEMERAIVEALDAQAKNPNAVVALVTDARDRFMRGEHYNGQPSTHAIHANELEALKQFAREIVLATILDPDAPFDVVRSHETNVPTALGDIAGKKVGRPVKIQHTREPKKLIRRTKINDARRWFYEDNVSKREIAKRLGRPESTIRAWLKRP